MAWQLAAKVRGYGADMCTLTHHHIIDKHLSFIMITNRVNAVRIFFYSKGDSKIEDEREIPNKSKYESNLEYFKNLPVIINSSWKFSSSQAKNGGVLDLWTFGKLNV